ncbi:MAG TPA: TetR family transcriptional regulator [Mycobacteriales bacterium]|nr:TetR family transcriptional regulator [Mycobacteriales bacterium]
MPRDGERTRLALIDAALALCAEQGPDAPSLADITAAAGQRNVSAIQYHFGSREGLLAAVLAPFTARVRAAREELIAAAGLDCSPRAAARAFVEPLAMLLDETWRERAFLRILGGLTRDPRRTPRELLALVGDTRARQANELLAGGLPRELVNIRYPMAETMVLHVLADEAARRETRSRATRRDRLFLPSLIDVYLAAMTSPPSDEVRNLLSGNLVAG